MKKPRVAKGELYDVQTNTAGLRLVPNKNSVIIFLFDQQYFVSFALAIKKLRRDQFFNKCSSAIELDYGWNDGWYFVQEQFNGRTEYGIDNGSEMFSLLTILERLRVYFYDPSRNCACPYLYNALRNT